MTTFGKRIDGVTGRRAAPRKQILLPAAVTTPTASIQLELLNISSTGARLRGDTLPRIGQDVLLKSENVEAFGTVVWNRGKLCGVHFDEPLSDLSLHRLRHEGSLSILARVTPDERLAADAWSHGSAR